MLAQSTYTSYSCRIQNNILTLNLQQGLSIRTCSNAESRRQVLVTRSTKTIYQDVDQHNRSLTVLDKTFPALDFIADVAVLDVDVLDAAMVYKVLRHFDA